MIKDEKLKWINILFWLASVGAMIGLILPDFMNQLFLYKNQDDTGDYISGDAGTTIVYLIQLIVELVCFIYVYVKVAKTIDYKKTLEEW